MYRVFTERLDKHRDNIDRRLSRRLKSQLASLRNILQGHARSWHVSILLYLPWGKLTILTVQGKVELLESEFDGA